MGDPKAIWETSSWSSEFKRADNNILLVSRLEKSVGLSGSEGSKTYSTLIDGSAVQKNNRSETTCLSNNASLTYAFLDAYSVKEIRIYSTWADSGRDELSIASIQAVTSAGETKTLSPDSIKYSGDGCCARAVLKNSDDSILCSDVKKVIFNFGTQENGYVGYSELEVVVSETFNSELMEISEDVEGKPITVTVNESLDGPCFYGLNGGNLVIEGSGTVSVQYVYPKYVSGNNKMQVEGSSVDFGLFWPWIKGTVTVQDGAVLKSDSSLFWGSGQGDAYKENERTLIIQSGGQAEFFPKNQEVHIVGVMNGKGPYVKVCGEGSRLLCYGDVYLGNKSDFAGHAGGMEVCDGGYVEMDKFYVGYHTGGLQLNIHGGGLKAFGGIYAFKNGNRWTGADIDFKDCLIETPVYIMTYPHGNGGSTVTFNGAVFKPIGTPAAKFIDASPTGDPRCPHTLEGNGLVVDAPEGFNLEVSAMLQGDGGFEKRGAGSVVISAQNIYTGSTLVSAGTLSLTGRVAGSIEVKSGATLEFSLPDQDAVPLIPSLTVEAGAALTAIDPQLPEGLRHVKVLETDNPITLPELSRDTYGNAFFVKHRQSGGSVLCYGRRLGFSLIVR